MKGCFNDPKTKVSQKDWNEISLFKRFLTNQKKYGLDRMLKKKYWRIYCGLEFDSVHESIPRV